MIELTLPATSARVLYETCVAGVSDSAKASLYLAAGNGIELASAEFESAGRALDFPSVVSERCPSPEVTKEMMIHLYDGQLLRRRTEARTYYDDLRASTPNGICPFCSHRRVTALDHFMPKASFPDLAVSPANLIPICSDCNKQKLNRVPGTAHVSPLNPYFDRLGDALWLRADVIETSPAALRFWVDADAFVDDVLAARVRSHLDALGLAELYAAEAATELLNIRHQLERLSSFHSDGEDVRSWLRDMAESCSRANPNGWRTAAYAAWSGSAWFCQGGFS